MSRASVSRAKYGVIGAGALSKSLIGQLPRKSLQIGPVAGVSFRVASRMANALRAGYAVKNADELDAMPVILCHAPPEQLDTVARLLETPGIRWKDKALIFCDCEPSAALLERFDWLGAAAAVARQFGIAGSIAVHGAPAALLCAHRIALELRLKALEITPASADIFNAAVTLATAALTPLVNRTATLLRAAGLRDPQAVRTATALFERTIQEFGHSGKQSWAWHVREPETERIEAEIAAVGEPFQGIFRQLIQSGFEDFEKHPRVARRLATPNQPGPHPT